MITDTTGGLFPEGTYLFRVDEPPESGQTAAGGYAYFQFRFVAEVDGTERKYSERFMVWMSGPLLKALGFEEIKPGHYKWEFAEAVDREITATIVHEPIAKGLRKGELVARMKNIRPAEMFEPEPPPPPPPPGKTDAKKDEDEIPF